MSLKLINSKTEDISINLIVENKHVQTFILAIFVFDKVKVVLSRHNLYNNKNKNNNIHKRKPQEIRQKNNHWEIYMNISVIFCFCT